MYFHPLEGILSESTALVWGGWGNSVKVSTPPVSKHCSSGSSQQPSIWYCPMRKFLQYPVPLRNPFYSSRIISTPTVGTAHFSIRFSLLGWTLQTSASAGTCCSALTSAFPTPLQSLSVAEEHSFFREAPFKPLVTPCPSVRVRHRTPWEGSAGPLFVFTFCCLVFFRWDSKTFWRKGCVCVAPCCMSTYVPRVGWKPGMSVWEPA